MHSKINLRNMGELLSIFFTWDIKKVGVATIDILLNLQPDRVLVFNDHCQYAKPVQGMMFKPRCNRHYLAKSLDDYADKASDVGHEKDDFFLSFLSWRASRRFHLKVISARIFSPSITFQSKFFCYFTVIIADEIY